MSYHIADIPRGVYGDFSKITEEFLEAQDALEQQNPVMVIQELSDLIGAIDGYVRRYNMDVNDLLVMTKATQRAFASGHRIANI
jgi:hypothetical protein